jgi:hypothetical protein
MQAARLSCTQVNAPLDNRTECRAEGISGRNDREACNFGAGIHKHVTGAITP